MHAAAALVEVSTQLKIIGKQFCIHTWGCRITPHDINCAGLLELEFEGVPILYKIIKRNAFAEKQIKIFQTRAKTTPSHNSTLIKTKLYFNENCTEEQNSRHASHPAAILKNSHNFQPGTCATALSYQLIPDREDMKSTGRTAAESTFRDF